MKPWQPARYLLDGPRDYHAREPETPLDAVVTLAAAMMIFRAMATSARETQRKP